MQLRPGTTPVSRVRHALRYLHEPAELRANPLTAPFFRSETDDEAGTTALRAVIRAALSPSSRAMTIVQECDFARRPHKAVQVQMHISERQFYRDRSHAFRIIAGALARRPVEVTTQDVDLALKIDVLTDLLDSGNAAAVAASVDEMLHLGVPGAVRARLHALRSGAALYRDDQHEAAAQLATAVALAADDPIAVADCKLAASRFPYVDGRIAESLHLLEDAVALAFRESLHNDPVAARAYARHLGRVARLHEEANDPRALFALLNEAKGFLLARTHGEHALLALLKIDAACAAMAFPEELPTAFSELADAHTLACRAGATPLLAWIEALTGIAKMTVRIPGALRHARLAVTFARTSLQGEWRARALMVASRVFAGSGEPLRALELIDEARTHVLPGRYIDTIAGFRRAAALHELRRYAEAVDAAEAACERIAAVNRSQFLGGAHLVAAAACAALGETKPAMAHLLDAALPILAGSGFAHDYLRANELALRLTGDAQYQRRVAELTSLLVAS